MVDLWLVDTQAAGPALRAIEQDVRVLSDWERQRAGSFADAGQAEEWLAAHIALRVVLDRVLDKAGRGVPFARSAHGKPRVEGGEIAFSLSHVPGLAIIALAGGGTIGVDLERLRIVHVREPRRARVAAAGAALAPGERLPQEDDARFLQAWARLEAFAKAEGTGVGRLLTRLGISGEAAQSEADFRARLGGILAASPIVATRDVNLGESLFAAVAAGPAAPAFELFRLPASKAAIAELLV